ncbi:GNAT family N-acetyltransferase [Flavitalea antarctica]
MKIENNNIIIREARESDIDQLYIFEQGVIAAERPFDPTLKQGNIHYYDLPRLIHSDDSQLLVAEIDGKLIASGYARIEKSEAFLQHRYHAYLGFMFVVEEYRGQGINKRIVADLQKWALSKNINELRLEVYYPNSAAIRAYEKIGFSKHMIEMRLPIAGDD